MNYRLRFVVAILAAVGCLSISLPGQGQEGVEYSLRSDTGLAGVAFLDPLPKPPVGFNASAEDGVLNLRLDLPAQSVILRSGKGELYISSSNNTAREFSTLSDEERQILQRLATLLDKKQESQSAFDASIICMIRNLSSWPTDMPLSVSIDSVMKTVGDVSVPMEEIHEARRQAMEDLGIQLPDGEAGISVNKTITSLCGQIGRKRGACYPTSLVPYRERCETVLLGGTTCRGRCGTTCSGLCSQQRYTQDCHSHDRCADIYGRNQRYCNFIFNSTFDDCASAPDCVDLPGVWTITYTWAGFRPGTTALNINPNRRFTAGDGATGTWNATDTSATLTFSVGCRPVYTATLSGDRLTASGTMRCTSGNGSGTWRASKTNKILPAARAAQANGSESVMDRSGVLSSPPD